MIVPCHGKMFYLHFAKICILVDLGLDLRRDADLTIGNSHWENLSHSWHGATYGKNDHVTDLILVLIGPTVTEESMKNILSTRSCFSSF